MQRLDCATLSLEAANARSKNRNEFLNPIAPNQQTIYNDFARLSLCMRHLCFRLLPGAQPNFDKQKTQVEFAHFEAHLRKAADDVSDVEPSRTGETAKLNAVRIAFEGTIATGGRGFAIGIDA